MRFQLPQFIETETKLVGPFTLKQFIWIAAGFALVYLAYLTFGFSVWFFLLAIIIGGIAAAMAYLKIDGLPLINYLIYAMSFGFSPKKYLFKKKSDKIEIPYK
jgi:hypothetical protein